MIAAIPFPDLSPEVFSIRLFGLEFALRWYALAYISGILAGWRIGVLLCRQAALWPDASPPLRADQIDDLLTAIILGIILGGRLGYVLFYQPAYYLAHPLEIPMIWTGGMAFHGGLIGVMLAVIWFARTRNAPLASIADLLAVATPLGILFGRLANFVNAELWGRPTDLPWGVIFPGEAAQTCGQLAGTLCARHPSQLYEAALEGLLLALLLGAMAVRGALRRPGLCAGTFFAGYGAARFLVEFVRQPDAQFVTASNPLGLALHVNGIGLTMGQILTLPMIAAGLIVITRALRCPPAPA